jgi:hypothetical protein
MYPYNAQDIVRVMRYEMTPDDERRHGARIARDIRREDELPGDGDRPDKGQRVLPRLYFLLTGFGLARGT